MSNVQSFSTVIAPWILIIAGFIVSFIITFVGIPSVVRIARIKSLYDIPGNRTSHKEPTPRLGGSMVFAGVILSSVLFTDDGNSFELKYIIAALIVLFFIGLKDDIITLQPFKKATGQLIASLIIVILGGIRISLKCNNFGSPELCNIISVLISLVIVMTLINSMNFIDGIDGLAAGLGIIASVPFGIWYILNNQISYGVVCFALTGSLMAFLWFNLFSKKYKIFLGDTGSMIIGFLLSVFLLRFLEMTLKGQTIRTIDVAPSLALAILIVPVFDLCRIVMVRIVHGKSPFNGDNNHIHHEVLKLFSGSHIKATTMILFANIIIIILVWLMRSLGNGILISFLLLISLTLSVILAFLVKKCKQKEKQIN